jgi:MFS family permease
LALFIQIKHSFHLNMVFKIPLYVTASIAISVGGLLNGYDTGSIGALATMSQFEDTFGKLSPTLLGFTVSLIMLTGGVPSVFAGHLADRWGRLKTIIAGSMIFVLGAVLQGSSYGLPQFLIGRAIAGLGEGIYISNMAVYICEIAPMKHRGVLAGLPQFMATAGVCLGYFTCYGTVHIPSSMAWRFPYVVMAAGGLILAASCLAFPDSPRWLILQNRRVDAIKALERLDFTPEEAHRDVLMQNEQRPSLSFWQGFSLLFKRGYRSRTILALFVLGMVQLSGIDGVLYVSNSSDILNSTHPLTSISMHPRYSNKLVWLDQVPVSLLPVCQQF